MTAEPASYSPLLHVTSDSLCAKRLRQGDESWRHKAWVLGLMGTCMGDARAAHE